MILTGQVGPSTNTDGTNPSIRQGKSGELNTGDVHGRFYEQCYRGNIYSFGVSNTALVSANAIATGLTSSAQPVIGLYNPSTSTSNLVILQAIVVVTTIANTAVNPGGFMWLYSVGNTAVSTGSTPINTKTLTAAGSAGKVFSVSTALTGLTNSLVTLRAAPFAVLNAAGAATAASIVCGVTQDNVDGSIIVPPGGVVALMNQVSTATVSVSTAITWEEVPV